MKKKRQSLMQSLLPGHKTSRFKTKITNSTFKYCLLIAIAASINSCNFLSIPNWMAYSKSLVSLTSKWKAHHHPAEWISHRTKLTDSGIFTGICKNIKKKKRRKTTFTISFTLHKHSCNINISFKHLFLSWRSVIIHSIHGHKYPKNIHNQ